MTVRIFALLEERRNNASTCGWNKKSITNTNKVRKHRPNKVWSSMRRPRWNSITWGDSLNNLVSCPRYSKSMEWWSRECKVQIVWRYRVIISRRHQRWYTRILWPSILRKWLLTNPCCQAALQSRRKFSKPNGDHRLWPTWDNQTASPITRAPSLLRCSKFGWISTTTLLL